jgi:hypothetical protein|tara:strand:+ start:1256 stop:1807 length:552 start_codon:yes stop_codon:yes gene_type:complete
LYDLDNGIISFVHYPYKFGVSVFVFIIGIIILFLNFEHFLPERVAMKVTSPLTVNLIAFVMILYVYSDLENNVDNFISLMILFAILIILLNLLKIPVKWMFEYLKRLKDREIKEKIIDGKKPIELKKKEIKKEEKVIRKAKREVKKEETKEEKKVLKNLDKQKKQAARLKKIVKKPVNKFNKN